MSEYTTGHCQNHKQPGGCQLHNVQCGYPNCDRKPVVEQAQPVQQEPVAYGVIASNTGRMVQVFIVGEDDHEIEDHNEKYLTPLYLAAGAQKDVTETAFGNMAQERKPLSDRRISWLWSNAHNDTTDRMAFQVFARAIEAKHGINEQP